MERPNPETRNEARSPRYRRKAVMAGGALVLTTGLGLLTLAVPEGPGQSVGHELPDKPDKPPRPLGEMQAPGFAESPLLTQAAKVTQEHQFKVAVLLQAEQARLTKARLAVVRHVASRACSGSPDEILARIRHRESRGNYGIDDGGDGGETNYGAYQFTQGTWNSTAANAGRSDLVGVNPAHASPGDQDAMARQLLNDRGTEPWGGSC